MPSISHCGGYGKPRHWSCKGLLSLVEQNWSWWVNISLAERPETTWLDVEMWTLNEIEELLWIMAWRLAFDFLYCPLTIWVLVLILNLCCFWRRPSVSTLNPGEGLVLIMVGRPSNCNLEHISVELLLSTNLLILWNIWVAVVSTFDYHICGEWYLDSTGQRTGWLFHIYCGNGYKVMELVLPDMQIVICDSLELIATSWVAKLDVCGSE